MLVASFHHADQQTPQGGAATLESGSSPNFLSKLRVAAPTMTEVRERGVAVTDTRPLEILRDLSRDSDAAKLLLDYFTSTKSNGLPVFSGSRFDLIGNTSDDPARTNAITAEDIAAVSCLGVNISGNAAVDLLEHKNSDIANLLEEISFEADLWDASQAHIEDGDNAASVLWILLREVDGVGPVRASKLMARKRPRLIPIYDKWIDEALGLGGSKGYWKKYRELMLEAPSQGAPLYEQLRGLVTLLDIPETITPLRACDVILWYSTNPRQADRRRRLGLREH